MSMYLYAVLNLKIRFVTFLGSFVNQTRKNICTNVIKLVLKLVRSLHELHSKLSHCFYVHAAFIQPTNYNIMFSLFFNSYFQVSNPT
jgi:hypothetical protein